MTEKTHYWIFYKERRYELLWDSRGMLPDELGIDPMNQEAETRRVYEAEYHIEDQLYLTKISVGPEQFIDQFPPIGDVYPVKKPTSFSIDDKGERTQHYGLFYHLKYPICVDGTITISRLERKTVKTLMEEPYRRDILKLKLNKGCVQAVQDVTERHQSLREAISVLLQEQFRKFRQIPKPNEERFTHQTDEMAILDKQYYDFLSEEIE